MTRNRLRCLAFGTLVLCLAFARESNAASLLFNNYTGEVVSGVNGGYTIGTEFTVGVQDLQVLSLGVYDDLGDGLLGPSDVGLWRTSDQSLITSATVPTGTGGTLIQDWRFIPVTPVTLLANTSYRIAALALSTGDPFRGTFSLGAGVSGFTANSSYGGSGPLTFPTTIDSVNVRLMANAEFQLAADPGSPVPEPASLLLLGTGLAVIARRQFRKRT